MNTKSVIKSIIVNQHAKVDEADLKPRKLTVPLDSKKIIVISGVRRCGKTSYLKLIRKKLLKNGIPLIRTLFISFDDERITLKANDLDLILQSYRELYPYLELNDCFFFFDEIQYIDDWERFVRRLYDSVSKNIFLSGSNSRQLGSEIATSLRGRTLQYELFPLKFSEYLSFKSIPKNYFDDDNKALIINAFYQYLNEGGFPETINKNAEIRQRILSDYFNVLLFRDIVERYRVSRIPALKYYIKKLLVNLGRPFSVNKIYNELKSQGIRTDKGLMYDIMEYIEAVYLGLRLYRFDYNVVNREMGDKKIYVVDNGLVNAITFRFSEDSGTLLENLVFIWLKQQFNENLFYYSKKNECDFVIFERDKAVHCIQVSFDISDNETLERELTGLTEAMNYFAIDRGTIITAEQEGIREKNGKSIEIVPAFRIMADDNYPF